MMIPEWMKEVDVGPCRCSAIYHGKKGFVGKTIDGIFSFLEEAFVSEFFQTRWFVAEPRSQSQADFDSCRNIRMQFNWGSQSANIHLFINAFIFIFEQDRRLVFHQARLAFIPIFAGIIAIPMIFNIFFPGDPLVQLFYLGPGAHLGPFSLPESIFVTRQGVDAAVIFTLRVATCVSATVLLFLTTPQQILFKSLRTVGVPRIYVLTLEMAYRYIFLLMDLVREMYGAKKARTIKATGMFEEQKWVGGRMGYTLIRSIDMSDKVHMAMMSRGYNGDVKVMQQFKMKNRDYLAVAAAISLSVLLVLISKDFIVV